MGKDTSFSGIAQLFDSEIYEYPSRQAPLQTNHAAQEDENRRDKKVVSSVKIWFKDELNGIPFKKTFAKASTQAKNMMDLGGIEMPMAQQREYVNKYFITKYLELYSDKSS